MPVYRQHEAVENPQLDEQAHPGAASDSAPAMPASVSLQEAIHQCIVANLTIRAGGEKIAQAEADFTQASLIPNPTLLLDTLLNPYPGSRFTVQRQGGPPQQDLAVTFPIDWCLFGKRVAAMEAARLGVDVAAADVANLVRLQVTETTLAFYDVLEAKVLLDIARLDLEDARKIESITERLVKGGELASIEKDRARLVLLDAQRDLRRREMNVRVARAKLAPLLGRCSPTDLDVRGELDVAESAAVPDLCVAMQIAEQQRPDLVALNRRIAMAEAEIYRERKKGYPEVNIQPVFTNQSQRDIGFPDAQTWGLVLTTTLPFSDRNQGNIAKAMSTQREAIVKLQGELANIRSEIKQAIDTTEAARDIVLRDDPAMVDMARAVRDKTELAFSKGQDSLLNLVITQRAYLERLRISASAKADYWRALQRLNAAVGGLTVPASSAPESLPVPKLGAPGEPGM